jgi:hypothetical protein
LVLWFIIVWAAVTTLAGGVSGWGVPAYVDATGTNAGFNGPAGVALDKQGNVFVAETGGQRIRMITPAGGTCERLRGRQLN